MDLDFTLLTPTLLAARSRYVSMLANDRKPYRPMSKRRVSEVDARKFLIWAYDYVNRLSEEKYRRLQQYSAQQPEYAAIEAHLMMRYRDAESPIFNLTSHLFWNDYIAFIKRECTLSQQGKQSYGDALGNLHRRLHSPMVPRWMQHQYVPQFAFMSEISDNFQFQKYAYGFELSCLLMAAFTAARIAMYPRLQRALDKAHSGLLPYAALVLELIAEVPLLMPAVLEAKVNFGELYKHAASSIQTRYCIPSQEILTEQPIEAGVSRDPQDIVIARDEVHYYLNNFNKVSSRRSAVALLRADDYSYSEIGEQLNIDTESVKTHLALMRRDAKILRLNRN